MPKANPKWISSEQFLRSVPYGTVFVSQLLPEEAGASPAAAALEGEAGKVGGGGLRRPRARAPKGQQHSEPQAAAEASGAHGYRHLLQPETYSALRRGALGARQRRGQGAPGAAGSTGGAGGGAGYGGAAALGAGRVSVSLGGAHPSPGAPLLHGALEYSPEYLDERRLPFFLSRPPIPAGQLFHALSEAERGAANEHFAPLLPARGADGEPTQLTFTKLCALKQCALELWVARGWELSTVALGFVAFERCVLAGRVGKANRRLYMAVCMLLAWKMNESRENAQGREAEAAREGGEAPPAHAAAAPVPMLAALAAAFRQPRAAIMAEEFPVFVQLSFSLHMRTRQVQPLLSRLEAATAQRQ